MVRKGINEKEKAGGRVLENDVIQGLIIGTDQAEVLIHRLSEEEQRTAGEHELIVRSPLNERVLQNILEEGSYEAKDCLCIAETEEAARAAQKLQVPCIAYSNPQLPQQAFPGVDLLLEGFQEIDWVFLENVHTRALGLPVVIASTEHLLIREMTLEDLDAFYELYREPSVRRFVKGPDENRKLEEERTKAYIQYMYGLYQFGMWVLIEKKSKALIGRAGYGIGDYEGVSKLDLGYLIGKPWQGRGLAQEACLAVLDYGREALGFQEVMAYIHPENLPSIGVIQKLGFEKCGTTQAEGELLLCFKKDLTRKVRNNI